MSHEEIQKGIEKDIEHEDHERHEKPFPHILKILLSLFFIILMVLFMVPIYSIKFDPMPSNIPKLSDVITEFKEVNNSHTITSKQDYYKLLQPSEPFIKQTAVKIATESCPSGGNKAKLCQAKALFYFVRDNIEYVSDPVFPADDYIETAEEVLMTGGSDCDGMAVLLANLEAAIGLPTKFVFIPGHVYIWVYLHDAPKKYFVDKKDNFGWIRLDATCSFCEFGEIPGENKGKETVVI